MARGDDLLAYYAEQQHKSPRRRKDGALYDPQTALNDFFAGRKVNSIDRDAASAFVTKRRAAGISNDAINNSLRLLRRSFAEIVQRDAITIAGDAVAVILYWLSHRRG